MNIDFKITIYFIAITLLSALLDFYMWVAYKNINLVIIITIFCIIIIGLSIMLIYALKSYMEDILAKLYQVISNIIDMNEEEVFSVLNDDVLSKLQSQVIKLTNILKGQNMKIKREGDEIKSLISDISHQLKTPLSNLNLYYELLRNPSISKEDYEEFSYNVQAQIEKLSFLIETMIKLSRLEGGIIVLKPKETSLNNICLTAIKQVYQKAKTKNIEIKFNETEDVILHVDKNWTVEAIFNILDNAVKYTGNGGKIMVNVTKYEMFARVDIIDNGLGIDEREINSIFKRFYRGDYAQNEEGVGIGLYITRSIIEKQSGYIKVKSKRGKGSTFSVFLLLQMED